MWFVTIGNIILLALVVLMFAQTIYLHRHSQDQITDNFRSFVKYSYCGGLLSPILDWIFLFYIISRVNSKSHGRSSSNPNFLDGSDDYADIADNDGMVVESHSGDKQVLFEDLRKDYSRPLNNRTSSDSTPPREIIIN